MPEARAAVLDADVAIIGGGPAGIAAAVSAAQSGARVVLVDEAPRPGGQIWRHVDAAQLPRIARRWIARLDRSGAAILVSTSVIDIGADEGFTLTAERAGLPLTISARRIIIATGARERFLPFPGWTLPGVVGAGGAQALYKSGAELRGRRIVVAGTGPLLIAVAGVLARARADVSHIIEQAPAARVRRFAASLWRSPGVIAQAVSERFASRRTRYLTGSWVRRASGDHAVREIEIVNERGGRETLPCELLCIGYGLLPSTELAQRLGCDVRDGRIVVDALQRTSVTGVWCAGEPTGIGGVRAALVEGEIAGRAAAGAAPPHSLAARRGAHRRFAARLEAAFALRGELRGIVDADTIVCRCEDVRYGAIEHGWSAREAKLRTRAGMGPCQGRVCGAALEFLLGPRSDTIRPPISPVRVSTLIGAAAAVPDTQ